MSATGGSKKREVSVRGISGRVHYSSMAFLVAAAFWHSEGQAQILVHFDLPAQPLARSLNAIGTATNTDVGFSASQVAGLIAPALKADLTVDDALMRVLVGTALRLRRLDDHTIVICCRSVDVGVWGKAGFSDKGICAGNGRRSEHSTRGSRATRLDRHAIIVEPEKE
jgi:hypothetical protein